MWVETNEENNGQSFSLEVFTRIGKLCALGDFSVGGNRSAQRTLLTVYMQPFDKVDKAFLVALQVPYGQGPPCVNIALRASYQ